MYLDPGFGGMLVQLIVPIIAVGGAVLFSFRRKIRALFSKGESSNNIHPTAKHSPKDTEDDVVDTLAEEE